MSDDMTPAPASGDTNATSENWSERYVGLQKVVAKRDETLRTTTAELDALRAEHEAAMAELTTFRAERDAATEDERARQTYEQLRQRFEAEPPMPVPVGQMGPRPWFDPNGRTAYQDRERKGTSSGWPT